MQALRRRFATTSAPLTSRDYFTYVPVSPTVRAPSLPSHTPNPATTPLETSQRDYTKHDEKDYGPYPFATPGLARRASTMRKQVAAGDLAMTTSSKPDENGGAYFRPAVTPGLPRVDTWRGRMSSTSDLRGLPASAEEETFELREAVLICIAKSIGLAHPSENLLDPLVQSGAPSVSAASTPTSPMFPPGGRSSSRSPFGNVLDMVHASNNSNNILGGMLREAVMHARGEDEISSVSGSVQDSQIGSTRNILSDLESNVEILFFKQGAALAKEGEKSPGIFYVIDGFLEVS